MDFTERMLERNRSRQAKVDTKESNTEPSAPLKEVHRNTVTTSVDIKKHSGSNKVTVETTVTVRKFPQRTSIEVSHEEGNDETTCTEGENDSAEEKENVVSQEENCSLRQDTKSRLQRLGVLYSDNPSRLSSPIHRTEDRFLSEQEPPEPRSVRSTARSRGRLAALAQTINQWEDESKHAPVGQESQGFSRSESNQRLIYNYNENNPLAPNNPSSSNKSPPRSSSPVKAASPIKTTSPMKSPVKISSPVKSRFCSPIQMGTSVVKPKEASVAQSTSSDEDAAKPIMGVKQLRSPRKAATPSLTAEAPRGSVLDRAQRYEASTSPPKRSRDPAELPLAERLALFERNAGAAVLPKAPFGMAVPAKKLQSTTSDRFRPTNQPDSHMGQPLPYSHSQQTSGSSSSLHDRLAKFERGADYSNKDHMKEILSERQKDMDMLKHRWDRSNENIPSRLQAVEPSAPPPTPPPPPPPLPSPPQQFEYDSRRYSGYYYEEEEEQVQPKISSHQVKPETTYPVLKEVKKIKLSPPKPGCIYPCLSDMEVESEVQESEVEDTDNERSSSSNSSNESDLNSLGQDIVKLSRSSLKRDWLITDDHSGHDEINEIDDFLDEALEDSSDEPTPPKRRSHSQHSMDGVPSTSFEYTQNSKDHTEQNQPLLHTVSFYRKQQNMALKSPSPVRHVYINDSSSSTDSIDRMEEELDRELKLVEAKIDSLLQEVKKQQCYISQASQALNLCYATIEFSGSTEQLEAEKLLLLATQRRHAAQVEIQRLRYEQTLRPKAPGNKTLTESGSITLSDITLPLKMDVIHRAAKDDQCYYLVCLVHFGDQVLSTDVVCAPRSLHSHNRLTFPNTLTLNNLYSDFKVKLEVYTLTARNKELIPHDVKYHINTSKKDASKLKLTPRKGKGESKLMMPTVQSPGGPSAVRTSAFAMAGFVVFSLRQIHRTQFTLNKVAYTSVLEGAMHLNIESEMSVDVEFRGFLTMFEDVSGFGAWHRRWCLLKGDKLSYWRYPDDERKKIALDTIELATCSTEEVDVVPRDVCARPNTFLLETTRPAVSTDVESLVLVRNGNKTTIRHLLSADTKEERIQWCLHLNKALALMRAWGPAAK